jgi:hypothetical protein
MININDDLKSREQLIAELRAMRLSVARLVKDLEITRSALADIYLSKDMTLQGARNKAGRIYTETGRHDL